MWVAGLNEPAAERSRASEDPARLLRPVDRVAGFRHVASTAHRQAPFGLAPAHCAAVSSVPVTAQGSCIAGLSNARLAHGRMWTRMARRHSPCTAHEDTAEPRDFHAGKRMMQRCRTHKCA